MTARSLALAPFTALRSAVGKLFHRTAPWDSASDDGWSIVRGSFPTNYTRTGRTARMIGWESNATVQACVRVVAEGLSAVPMETYKKLEDGSPVVQGESDPFRMLLDRPRQGMTGLRLRNLTAVHYQLYGNAFWVIERKTPTGAPVALQLVHPEWVQYVFLNRDTLEPAYYEWRDRWGGHHQTLATDMIHHRDASGGDWLFGYPRAAVAIYEMASEREASEYVRHILSNDGSPGHVAMMAEGVTTTQAKQADRAWREKMVERGGRGSVRFLAGVKDFKVIGFNLGELEFPELRSISRESICTAFNVDPRIVGATSAKGNEGGLSQSAYAEARRRLYAQAVVPMMRDLEATIDMELGVEFGFRYARFNPDAISDLTETAQERATRVQGLAAARLVTREESRHMLRLPEAMVPTDTIVGTMGGLDYLVAESSAKTAAALAPKPAPVIAAPAAGADAGAGKVDEVKGGKDDPGGLGGVDAGADVATADRARRSSIPRKINRRGVTLTPDARVAVWERTDAKARRQEGPYRRTAAELLTTEKDDVVGMLRSAAERAGGGRAHRDDGDDPYLAAALLRIRDDFAPGGKYHEEWLTRYRALVGETMTGAAADFADQVGVSFNLEAPHVQDAIRARVATLAAHVTDYSAQTISDIIGAGRSQGMGIRDVANLLETSLDGMTEMRATRIARTETIGALNQGEMLGAKESGVIATKEWLTMGDDRVRDSHAAQDGEQQPLSGIFTNGCAFPGDPAGGPEETINCRCTLLYYDTTNPDAAPDQGPDNAED